ncbi:hypothetical protein L2E82_49605, partial [Cichorium intybus]
VTIDCNCRSIVLFVFAVRCRCIVAIELEIKRINGVGILSCSRRRARLSENVGGSGSRWWHVVETKAAGSWRWQV